MAKSPDLDEPFHPIPTKREDFPKKDRRKSVTVPIPDRKPKEPPKKEDK